MKLKHHVHACLSHANQFLWMSERSNQCEKSSIVWWPAGGCEKEAVRLVTLVHYGFSHMLPTLDLTCMGLAAVRHAINITTTDLLGLCKGGFPLTA